MLIFIFDVGVIFLLWEKTGVISSTRGHDSDLGSLLLLAMACLQFCFFFFFVGHDGSAMVKISLLGKPCMVSWAGTSSKQKLSRTQDGYRTLFPVANKNAE